jgi:hypothetical protein
MDAAGRQYRSYVDLKVEDIVGFGKVVGFSWNGIKFECTRCGHHYERSKKVLAAGGQGGKGPLGYCGREECIPKEWVGKLRGVRKGMIKRCYNTKAGDFIWYGARAITVCAEWRDSLWTFIASALGKGWQPGLQIDRIDNSQGYNPDNVHFVTPKVNSRNTRSNRLIRLNGQTKTLTEWAEEYNICRGLLGGRLYKGWSFEKALTYPVKIYAKRKQLPAPNPRPRITKTSSPSPQDNPSASRPRLRTKRPRLSDYE